MKMHVPIKYLYLIPIPICIPMPLSISISISTHMPVDSWISTNSSISPGSGQGQAFEGRAGDWFPDPSSRTADDTNPAGCHVRKPQELL